MLTRLTPKFGTNGVKTYTNEINMTKAVEKVLIENDRWIGCYDSDSKRWAPVILCTTGMFGSYAHYGFTVTTG